MRAPRASLAGIKQLEQELSRKDKIIDELQDHIEKMDEKLEEARGKQSFKEGYECGIGCRFLQAWWGTLTHSRGPLLRRSEIC